MIQELPPAELILFHLSFLTISQVDVNVLAALSEMSLNSSSPPTKRMIKKIRVKGLSISRKKRLGTSTDSMATTQKRGYRSRCGLANVCFPSPILFFVKKERRERENLEGLDVLDTFPFESVQELLYVFMKLSHL